MPRYDWANGDSVEVFWVGDYGFSNLRVGAILRNGCGIQEQKFCCITPEEWNDSRVSLQELDFMYIMF